MFLNDIADALTAKQIREAARKQRLDKSCWTGYHKAGTKVKGDTRVNNCVPNESVTEGDPETHTRGDPHPDEEFYFPVKDQWPEKLGPMGKPKSRSDVDVKEGTTDIVTFGVDSEKAYNHVMAKFGKAISWDGDDMVAPRKYWAAIQQLAHDAGGAAEETGYEQDIAETTGDKPFDNMMTTIKKGTKKQATADRREQKRQDQERTRAAIDNMFGSSMNQFKNLKIKEQGVAEAEFEPHTAKFGKQVLGHKKGQDEPMGTANIEIQINGRTWKIFPGAGPENSKAWFEQKQKMREMCARKTAQTGKEWKMYITGKPPTVEGVEEGKFANALGAFTLGAAGVAGMMGNQDIDYKGYSFHHAPRAMSVPGSAKLMKVDGKELFMWRAINPEEGGPKYFYKTKDETRIDNAMGMNENFEPGETKRVLKSGGKPAGEIGLDPEASPGNGAYYLKHYASGKDLGGYDTYQEALEELRYIDKQYQYANKPADTRSKHEKMMDNSTYAEGYRDGVRGERNPRASNIFGPMSDVYDQGYEAGRVAKKGVGEDSWHGAGDEWHGTGDQWSGGGADGGAAPLMEYPMAQSVPADSDSPIHEAPGRIRMLKRLAKATGIDLSDLEHMTDAELRELYKEKVIVKLREFVPSDVQGPGVDDAQSPIAGKKRLSLNHDVEAPKPMGVAERKEQRLMALRLAEMRRAGYFD